MPTSSLTNDFIQSPYFTPGHSNVNRIVIHTTICTFEVATQIFTNSSRQVSAHYLIRKDGFVRGFVNENDTAWHAGEWDVNLRSIGIEHVDDGDYDDVIRTPEQYAKSGALVRDICTRYNLPIDRVHIVGHREVHATACPDGLDVDRIVRIARGEEGGDNMTGTEIINALKSDPKLAHELYALVAPDIQEKVVAPEANTETAIKAAITTLSAQIAALTTRLDQLNSGELNGQTYRVTFNGPVSPTK